MSGIVVLYSHRTGYATGKLLVLRGRFDGRVDEKRMTAKAHPLTVACWLAAAYRGVLVASPAGTLAIGAIAGLLFLAWKPAVVLVLFPVIFQEVEPGGGYSGMTVFGAEICFAAAGKMLLIAILLDAAAAAVNPKRCSQPYVRGICPRWI